MIGFSPSRFLGGRPLRGFAGGSGGRLSTSTLFFARASDDAPSSSPACEADDEPDVDVETTLLPSWAVGSSPAALESSPAAASLEMRKRCLGDSAAVMSGCSVELARERTREEPLAMDDGAGGGMILSMPLVEGIVLLLDSLIRSERRVREVLVVWRVAEVAVELVVDAEE